MKNTNIKKLTVTAIFVTLAIVGSLFSFPLLGSRCAPVQHFINILCAIFLGPTYGVAAAFLASLLRNILGLGTFLAFPGSMCGAFLSGILYKYSKKFVLAYFGEIFGTAIIGGMLSYPVALLLMENSSAALFTFVIPFFISTSVGTIMAIIIITTMQKSGIIQQLTEQLQ